RKVAGRGDRAASAGLTAYRALHRLARWSTRVDGAARSRRRRTDMDSKPTILCVDDEMSLLNAFQAGLRRRFDLLIANSGQAALEQHHLITAERVLLEQTLHGCVKMLVDVLSLTNPIAFGRANRIKRLVADIAERLQLQERWQLEVAAMLSQLGAITLPAET